VTGYYDNEPRPTGVAALAGSGHVGRGECVAWTAREQAAFASACDALALPASATVWELSQLALEHLADPYGRAALEGAAIDLALRQAGENPFRLARRDPESVAFCWSLGSDADPEPAIRRILGDDPDARLKVDVPPGGWPGRTWESLARTGRVVVADFKRAGNLEQVRLAHAWLPDAWIEDPPVEASSLDPTGHWRARVALDGYVLAAVDLEEPAIPPAAVNVKAPRVGGWLEALRCLETCRRRGWQAYIGGMFEVGVGRAQARVLASLFTSRAWNDLAPVVRAADSPRLVSPLAVDGSYAGFAPGS
jgi:L-alanine-DL-glutamate epimerase-like enolase superfamily enzyme